MELYDNAKTGPNVCRNHTFFGVPGTCPYLPMMVFEKEKHRIERLSWLDELYTKYSTMEYSNPEDDVLEDMTRREDSTVAIWMLRLRGLDVFNIRAVWAFRRAFSRLSVISISRMNAGPTAVLVTQD